MLRFILSAVVVLVLVGCATSGAQAACGKAEFDAKCGTCHGLDAKGKPAMAAAMKAEPTSLDLTRQGIDCAGITKVGKGKMPAFSGTLEDACIQEICTYIGTLGK